MRRNPEHHGYGMPPAGISLAAGVVILIYAVMICLTMKRAFQERCIPRNAEEDSIYTEEALLRDLTPDSNAAAIAQAKDGSLTGLGYSMSPHRKLLSWCDWFDKHLCSERLWCVSGWILWIVVTVLTIVGVGACVFYPLPPEYTICNQQMNWNSVFQGMRQLGVRGDVTLLVSFDNPNRLAAHIETARSTFTWGNDYVGKWELETDLDLVASEGDVVDYQMTIQFEPSLYDAYYMYNAYTYKHNLTLAMDLHISGYLSWGGWRLHSFDSYYMPTEIKCNSPSDRKLCKCKSWT